jgi:O-antigen/teichoic acid export membrane protein
MKKSLKNILAGDALKLAPGLLTQLLGGFGISILLGRYLAPEEMGIYTLFWLAQAYAVTLFTGWLQNASIRFLPENKACLSQFVKLSLKTVVITGVIGIVGALVFMPFWQGLIKSSYVFVSIAIFSFSSLFSIFQCQFRGLFVQKEFSISAVFLVTAKIALLIAVLPPSKDPVYAALMVMAVSYLPVLVYHGMLLRRYLDDLGSEGQQTYHDSSLFRRSFSYGMPLTLSLFVISLLQTGDRYLLSSIVTLEQVGIYAFWMTIGLQLGQGLYRIIFMAVNPRLFQVYSKDRGRAAHYVHKLIGLYLLVAVPLFTVLGCVLPPALGWMKINPDYAPASHLIFFGLAMALLLGLAQLSGKQREFAAKTNVFVYAALTGVAIMAAGVYVMTPVAGLEGAASASLAGFVGYFAIIASASKGWPALREVFIAVSGSIMLFTIYRLGIVYFGAIVGAVGMAGLLVIYLTVVYRMYGRNRLVASATQ